MRVIFSKAFDYVTLRAKNGMPRAMVAYTPDEDPQTVKREHGEAAVESGAAKEVKEPDTMSGKDDARSSVASAIRAKASGTADLTDSTE